MSRELPSCPETPCAFESRSSKSRKPSSLSDIILKERILSLIGFLQKREVKPAFFVKRKALRRLLSSRSFARCAATQLVGAYLHLAWEALLGRRARPVSYTHLRAHETGRNLVCRLLLEKKKKR